MIECIFTIDYEIYGNGEGSLKELVYEPAQRLKEIFLKFNTRFVVFVEVAELEMIEAKSTDPAIGLVKHQIKNFYKDEFELGLHIHPQWYNAQRNKGKWLLDYNEYNLCTLPRDRIVQIVDRSITFLQKILGINNFIPLSFRAGNWLFQPTQTLSKVLTEKGIKIDSSVFKGGLQRQYKLDYRRALKNGYWWKFSDDVETPDNKGGLFEIPIYTQMVPFWKMVTSKRFRIQRRLPLGNNKDKKKVLRLLDFLRFWFPLKLDFCRMTIDELTRMIHAVTQEDKREPTLYRPIVAIGHTKDLVDFKAVEYFLSYLDSKQIPISTYREVYGKLSRSI